MREREREVRGIEKGEGGDPLFLHPFTLNLSIGKYRRFQNNLKLQCTERKYVYTIRSLLFLRIEDH